jgi:hypothetical protein
MHRSPLFSRFVSIVALSAGLFCGQSLAADDSSKNGGDSQDSSGNASKKGGGDSSSKGGSTSGVTVGSNTGVMESYVLADVGLRSCAAKIVGSLPAGIKTLVLFDQAQRDMLAALTSFQINSQITSAALSTAIKGYDDLVGLPADLAAPSGLGAGITAAAPVVGSLISSITTLVGLFRADVTIGGTVLTFDDEIIIDEVSRGATKAEKAVFRPSVFFADVFDPNAVMGSQVVTELTHLYDQRNQAQTRILDLQSTVTRLNTRLKAAKTDSERSHINQYLIPRMAALANLQAAVAVFDAVMAHVITPPQATTPPSPPPTVGSQSSTANGGHDHASDTPAPGGDKKNPPVDTPKASPAPSPPSLAALVSAELWLKKFRQAGVGLVTLHTQVAGGGYEAKSNFWTFFGGAKFSYSGGSVSSFSVISATGGNVLTSGSCPAYTGFVRGPDVTKGAKAPLP